MKNESEIRVDDEVAGKPGLRINFKLTWGVFTVAISIFAVVMLAAYGGVEYYTSSSEFCGGSCHNAMDEQYQAWQNNHHHAKNNDKGVQAECIDCHFLPGEKNSLKAKFEGARHLFAYLYDKNAPLPIRPKIPDGACLQSGCHATANFEDKELPFAGKAKFKHKVHFTDKALDGQKLTCDTCHFKVTAEKHFEVPKEICYLCHLKLEKPTLEKVAAADSAKPIQKISFAGRPAIDFNEGRSRCGICHTIPTKSLQAQLKKGDALTKPITHQSIKKAGVACESCHFEVVKGHGEIETGNVVANGCLTCHNRSKELLVKATDGKLMHDSHVNGNKADCFDCHNVIEHRNRTDHLDFVREDCLLCHQDQHKYQKLLLAGTPINENVSATPHLMFNVNVNCMGCHLKKTVSNGHSVRTGAPETCVACHTDQHRKMVADWQKQVDEEVTGAEEVEAEALQALKQAEGKLAGDKFKQASAMIAKGSEYLDIVRFGNGVHNKKYAITIIDQAFAQFDDAIALLDDGG
jgi:nitrate/TMAO reductase-like tetraheme cytochrome c subunit